MEKVFQNEDLLKYVLTWQAPDGSTDSFGPEFFANIQPTLDAVPTASQLTLDVVSIMVVEVLLRESANSKQAQEKLSSLLAVQQFSVEKMKLPRTSWPKALQDRYDQEAKDSLPVRNMILKYFHVQDIAIAGYSMGKLIPSTCVGFNPVQTADFMRKCRETFMLQELKKAASDKGDKGEQKAADMGPPASPSPAAKKRKGQHSIEAFASPKPKSSRVTPAKAAPKAPVKRSKAK